MSANPVRHIGTQLEALVASLAVLPSVGRQLALMRRDVKGLREDIGALPDLIVQLTAVVERMTKEVEGMHRDVVVIGDRVQPLASQLEPLAPSLSTLDPRLSDLMIEIRGMRADLNRLPFVGGGRRRRGEGQPIAGDVPDPADAANDAA